MFEVTPMTHSGSRRYSVREVPDLFQVQFEQLDCSILVFGSGHATAEFMALVASAATWPLPSWAQQQVSPVFARENLMRRRTFLSFVAVAVASRPLPAAVQQADKAARIVIWRWIWLAPIPEEHFSASAA